MLKVLRMLISKGFVVSSCWCLKERWYDKERSEKTSLMFVISC